MRIVFDDTKLGLLTELIDIWANTRAKNVRLTEYSYGTQRISKNLVKSDLKAYLAEKGFEIGNTVHHENGIGNNNRYPVYYHTEDEVQQVGYLHIIINPYGGGSVYVTNYNAERQGICHRLSKAINGG